MVVDFFVLEGVEELTELSLEEREILENKLKQKVLLTLRKKIYHWEPIRFMAL